jgi:hypothetical protein
MKSIAIFVLFLLLAACKTAQLPIVQVPPPPKDVKVTLYINQLKVNDLEESLTRQDEVLLAYTLTLIDSTKRAVAAVNGTWGVQKVRKGALFGAAAFKPIQLAVPRGGKIVASVVLMEVDDYSTTQKWVKNAQKVTAVVGVPAAFLEVGTMLTPLKYVTAGLVAAGVGFELTQKWDTDDLLGQSGYEWAYAQAKPPRRVTIPAAFKGKHLRTSYFYELSYELRSGY